MNGGPGPKWGRLLGDAFNLPLRDELVDVIIADPPYEGTNRGKKGIKAKEVGYIPFAGREWFDEAWRVLKPSGHLYLFAAVRELPAWMAARPEIADVIAWHQPNNASVSAYWRRGTGGRAPAWRPIIHYQKAPTLPIPWNGYVHPNFIQASAIQSTMREALPWPNQLPVRMIRWLLSPHEGVVLDLFSGTGTTGEAALGLGLACISVDASLTSFAVARRRAPTLPLSATKKGSAEKGPKS